MLATMGHRARDASPVIDDGRVSWADPTGVANGTVNVRVPFAEATVTVDVCVTTGTTTGCTVVTGLLEAERAGHEFTVDALEGTIGQRAGVRFGDLVEYLGLAVGGIDWQLGGPLEAAHLDHQLSPVVEQLHEPFVQRIDADPDAR